jgi:hypothetical protein
MTVPAAPRTAADVEEPEPGSRGDSLSETGVEEVVEAEVEG